MALGKDRGQDLFHDFSLADNHAAELVGHQGPGLAELREIFANAIGGHRWPFLDKGEGE